jgi:hypothetical protein
MVRLGEFAKGMAGGSAHWERGSVVVVASIQSWIGVHRHLTTITPGRQESKARPARGSGTGKPRAEWGRDGAPTACIDAKE